jgi:hypothetical protein
MRVESFFGRVNEIAIEPLLARASLVARGEQHRVAPRIEGKRGTPYTARRFEAQLLQIRVSRAL